MNKDVPSFDIIYCENEELFQRTVNSAEIPPTLILVKDFISLYLVDILGHHIQANIHTTSLLTLSREWSFSHSLQTIEQ